MKSFIVCAIIAITAIQLVRGDGYAAPTQTYTYDYSSGYDGAVKLSGDVCQGIVANLGIQGCTKALEGYGSSGDSVNCYSACSSYVTSFVGALKAGGVLSVQAGGTVQIIAGYTKVTAGGLLSLVGSLATLVKGVVGAALDLTAAALTSIKVIAGGLIGGLLGGVAGTLDFVIGQLNILIGLVGKVGYKVTCASTQCNGYTAPSYA